MDLSSPKLGLFIKNRCGSKPAERVTWFVVPYIVTAQVTLDKPTQACIMNARSDHQVTGASFHIILYCTVIVVHDGGKINRGCCGSAEGWLVSSLSSAAAACWPILLQSGQSLTDSPDKGGFQAPDKIASVSFHPYQ